MEKKQKNEENEELGEQPGPFGRRAFGRVLRNVRFRPRTGLLGPQSAGDEIRHEKSAVEMVNDDGALHEESPSPYPWIRDPALADYDFLQLMPANQMHQAVQLGFVCEPSCDHSYRKPDWATNWMSYEEFKNRHFYFVQMSFCLTKQEADLLLSSGDGNKSPLTAVRDAMKNSNRHSNIRIQKSLAFDPFYRFAFLRGPGHVLYGALQRIHQILQENLYDNMSKLQREQAIPLRPPVHPAGSRPMILSLHFDPKHQVVAVNRGYCYICMSADHLALGPHWFENWT